ncbi:CoA transferase subunit A [Tamaricihabitans halophyticus]|nr:CoA-transferase [Tamaricihabitans halophyticus]
MTAPSPIRTARAELESTVRPVTDKRVSAAEAIELVRSGDHIAVGGTNYARTPMALLFEILRQERTGLTLSRPLSCYEVELFLGTGMADTVVTSWVGIGHGWGLARILRHCVENGQARFEEWSHLGMGMRYQAGAMGVPFLPTVSMLGSDLANNTETAPVVCPFTGQRLLAIPSLNPDVALIHVHRADQYGNAQIDGYPLMDAEMARASRRVVLSAEEIVTTEEIRRDPGSTVIPHFAVDAVVEVPYGAYPHECYGKYEVDSEHVDEYMRAVRETGVAAAREYVERHVGKHADFSGFLADIGSERLRAQQLRAQELMPR